MRRLYVNVYERDLEYGGPEEGGWWFNTFTKVSSLAVKGEKMAQQWKAHIEKGLEEPEIPLHSVRYQGGSRVVFIEEHPAKNQPEVYPHYE